MKQVFIFFMFITLQGICREWTVFDRNNSPVYETGLQYLAVDSANRVWVYSTDEKRQAHMIRYDHKKWQIENDFPDSMRMYDLCIRDTGEPVAVLQNPSDNRNYLAVYSGSWELMSAYSPPTADPVRIACVPGAVWLLMNEWWPHQMESDYMALYTLDEWKIIRPVRDYMYMIFLTDFCADADHVYILGYGIDYSNDDFEKSGFALGIHDSTDFRLVFALRDTLSYWPWISQEDTWQPEFVRCRNGQVFAAGEAVARLENNSLVTLRTWTVVLKNNGKLTAFEIAPDGKLWAGTENGSLINDDDDSIYVRNLFPGQAITAVDFDRWGNVWLLVPGTGVAVYNDGLIVSADRQNVGRLPVRFSLHDPAPNPFNPSTTIRYDLPESSEIDLTVYNCLGQKVKTLICGRQDAGSYQVQWQGKDDRGMPAGSGMYICVMRAGSYREHRKLILLR
ncbi:T9SS type A sorting domain-containing protein [bacterium]|nr:T9SS type A sorting domain-containing protein [bacterium]